MKCTSIFTTRAEPIEVGPRRQLFLDDYCIEEQNGLSRRLHRPAKCGPVLTPDSHLGQISLQSRSAPQWNPDRGLWEWWYWGSWACEPYGPYHATSQALTHYATSRDGVHWDKPSLGLHEWRGSKDNNVAFDPAGGHRGLYHCLRDERDPDPGRRYKGLLSVSGRAPVVSPDGFEWRPVEGAEIPSSDESNFFYDPFGRQYVAIVKRGTVWGRSMAMATSQDFEHWQDHGIVMHADHVDWDNRMPRIRALCEGPDYLSPPLVDEADYIAETYNMAVMPYEGIYVGLVNIFNPAGAIPPPQTNYTGINQVELAVSRNLRNWRRLCDREVFLAVEPWEGVAYDTQQLLPAGSPIVRDDEIWVYYNACRFRGHKELHPAQYHPYFESLSALSLAKLRLDGFVSLDAADEGTLLTRALTLTGQNLCVNANASAGEIRAQVLDAATMAPLADFDPVREDGVRIRVGSAGVAPGTVVRIRFMLEHASLYSFWTQPSATDTRA